jgi:hypothetical protein
MAVSYYVSGYFVPGYFVTGYFLGEEEGEEGASNIHALERRKARRYRSSVVSTFNKTRKRL